MYNSHNKSHVFNVVDILLVITAITVLILFANYFIFNYGFSDVNNTNINYVLKIDALNQDLTYTINVGDTVYNDDGKAVGRIKRLEYTDNYQPSDNGQATTLYKTVLVTVNADCRFNGTKYYLHNECITAGNYYTFRLSDYVSQALCINLTPTNLNK